MKILRFECFSGISGDMTIAALNDLGVPADYIINELKKLNVDGFAIDFEKVVKNGITANFAKVSVKEEHCHRHFSDILEIINKSGITESAKKMAADIFRVIAEAEGRVHGETPENVHFHEVGAMDSIVDIVGTAVCVDYLKPDKITVSVINDGTGFIQCQHGTIPVPVPAVAEIFAAKKISANSIDIEGELVTPTGAGIIAALADFSYKPAAVAATKIGYGAGSRSHTIPNVLRVSLCESDDTPTEVTIIEANIDDQTPESLAYAMERLLEGGALDVFFTPIYMKKNRPAVMLSVICEKAIEREMCGLIFENTTTIGVRMYDTRRVCLNRRQSKVLTPYGEISVKLIEYGNSQRVSPEYESLKQAALRHGVCFDDVYKSALKGELL